jgi:glycosyltransferase involved in cell wall biosynthesis
MPKPQAGFTPFEAGLQAAIHRGRTVAGAATALRRSGFRPEVVFAHLGWGEALFLKDVFPQAKLLLYCEFFYGAAGADVGFDPQFPSGEGTLARLRMKNAPLLMALDAADHGLAPTRWQRSRFPAGYASRISVIHDGVDTDLVKPDPSARFRVPGSDVVLTRDDEVVTYVARNLEPYRGFHSFMRAIPEIQRRRPKAKVVILGGDEVSYSARLPAGETYRGRMLRELDGRIDQSRVFMPGRVPYADHLALLRISSAHVYLTYPFVLSWSLLEAMSAECLVIGSRTAPVEEVIRDGENGLLVDFFRPDEIAARVEEAIADAAGKQALRKQARRTVLERYDLRRVCLPTQVRLVGELTSRTAA